MPTIPKVIVDAPARPKFDRAYLSGDEFRTHVATVAAADSKILAWVAQPMMRPTPVTYDTDGGRLTPRTTAVPDPKSLAPGFVSDGQTYVPIFTGDTAFRDVRTSRLGASEAAYRDHFGRLMLAGTFDPSKLTEFSGLSAVSLETYAAPHLVGADQRIRDLLGGRPLLANGNSAGYAATPPTLLTSVDALSFIQDTKPLSAIRVRVAGASGVDDLSRERVRLAAQRISTATGLDVDITIGSSPEQQTVILPAGRHGRPLLILTEGWSRKGVGLAIVEALDRKSLILFALILVVCFLFLTNAVTAAIRDRRRELAVLASVGWPRHRLAALIAGEVWVVGLVAGLISTALAIPISAIAGISLDWRQALLALPVGVGVAVLAAAVPAWRGAQVRAAASLERGVATAGGRRRLRRRRTVIGMAASNLTRSPGRTLLGAIEVAIGIAALTVLSAITLSFRGAITGTLLGDVISVQVRGVDAVAVAATVLLGLIAQADMLYLNLRDRAAEFAALRATGWSEPALGWLVAWEGLGVGALGAVLGAAVGMAAVAGFAREYTTGLGWLTATLAAAGVLVAGLAAVAPAYLQSRLAVSVLLAEE